MSLQFKSRVYVEISGFSGTGSYTVGSAITGYTSFVGIADGSLVFYEAVEIDGTTKLPSGGYEEGLGTLSSSGTVIARTSIKQSSNGNNAVSWSSATLRIMLIEIPSSFILPPIIQFGGRLTLETGVPVSTTDQLAKGNLFYTPYLNNQAPFFDGSCWRAGTFTEYDLTLSLTSGKNYDVFWNGTALSLSSAWTNDTTRADALATQDGVECLSSDHTKLRVGTIRASGTNLTADSGGLAGTTQVGATRYVQNKYNRVPRPLLVRDTTDSWSYTSTTIRQANGAAGNKIQWVAGDLDVLVDARSLSIVAIQVANGNFRGGMGLDTTTAFTGLAGAANITTQVSTLAANIMGYYNAYPGVGYHYLSWNESGDTGSITLFIGDNNETGGMQSGVSAVMSL